MQQLWKHQIWLTFNKHGLYDLKWKINFILLK